MVSELNTQRIRDHIIEGLAEVRDVTRADVDRDIEQHGGDLRIDSKEGEAICAIVEDALAFGELIGAADLQPEELSSISSLTRLIEDGVAEHRSAEGKDAA
jgi:hypothetical protein